ncbi:hypothetical protein [Halobaculum sp. D14]|uniref:hypothetical protein n=1 Tax=Halobaculum sp. D14 TaxID=3421642 RepID=UPI003EC08897
MRCRARQERAAHNLAAALATLPAVAAVDTLGPNTGPRPGWTVEATLSRPSVPPAVTRCLAIENASLVDASPKAGTHIRIVATV